MRTGSGRECGNCIAVVVGTYLSEENVPPMAALWWGDGEFEGGLAGGVAENRGTGKKAPTQGGQFGALGLAEPALEADAQVVGADGVVTGGLGRPKRPAAQTLQAELGPEFLDPIFDVGAAVVAAPDFEGTDAGWQIGAQRLELVAGHVEQLFPAGVRPLDDPLAQDDEPNTVVDHVLHVDPWYLGRSPRRVIVPAERAHRRAQRRGHDILQAAGLQLGNHPVRAKTAIGADQGDAHGGGQAGQRVAEERSRAADAGG